MNPSPLTIVATATAAPGQEATLRAAQEQLVAKTIKEPGCLRYELHQSREDSRILVFVETWASEALWRAAHGWRGHQAFPRQRREQADCGFLASPDEFGCGWQSQSQMTATPNQALERTATPRDVPFSGD